LKKHRDSTPIKIILGLMIIPPNIKVSFLVYQFVWTASSLISRR
jgi:hypothetical protein